MQELWIGILGTAGTILSTFSLMPQVLRTWRTRSANDISAAWLIAAMASMMVWVGYGGLDQCAGAGSGKHYMFFPMRLHSVHQVA